MSNNSPDDPVSPSDRFLPYRAAGTTSLTPIPLSISQPGPTSDLSQAIGNLQSARDGHYRPQSYQPQAYQFPSYQPPNPSLNCPSVSATTLKDAPGTCQSRAKCQWSREEDALIIKLRGKNTKWEEIAKEFPGRSAIACRLRYQNYLEKGIDWTENSKDNLARVYHK